MEEAPPALPLAMDLAGASGLRFSLSLVALSLLFWLAFRVFLHDVWRLAQQVHLIYFFLHAHRPVLHWDVEVHLQHLSVAVSVAVFVGVESFVVRGIVAGFFFGS